MQPMPEHTKQSIDDYVKHGECGDFLEAVLSNDLTEAVCRADFENLAALEAIVKYVYNHIPRVCWGSPEKVRAWREARRAERAEPERSELSEQLWQTGLAMMRAQMGGL